MIPIMMIVPLIRMLVLALLLIGSERMCLEGCRILRIIIGVLVGGFYTHICLYPGLEWIAHPIIHCFVSLMVGFIGIGRVNRSLLLFVSLNLFLDGVTANEFSICAVLFSLIGGLGVASVIWKQRRGTLLPVTLSYGDKFMSIHALYDTGNTLVDPISGRSVLVVSSSVGKELFGLTDEQIRYPVDNVDAFPGLRLIPFKTIGNASGFMLGLMLDEVKIAGKRGSRVIAFAPNGLDEGGKYQALAGGNI